MNVLWFSWKDSSHPLSGGAETVSTQIRERLARDGHNVRLITSQYPGSASKDSVKGVEIFRAGGRFGVYVKARRLFKKNFKGWPDIIIDEMNTIPFGAALYTKGIANVLLTYQLAREVWFYQMAPPFSWIGYVFEPLYLRLMSAKYARALTESKSTADDLCRYGFSPDKVHVFRVGMELEPIQDLGVNKISHLILVHGSIRPMKRTLDAIKAFEHARDIDPDLELVVSGDATGNYGDKVRKYVNQSRHSTNIKLVGRVSSDEKIALMQEAAVILVTSVKEGWGLIVTEANSQGTPAIAYDTDGLRDSVQNAITGITVPNHDFSAMGEAIIGLLSKPKQYQKMRAKAWEQSKEFTFENSYKDFVRLARID